MALSATFTANFDSFFKAVEQADKAMQEFSATVNKSNKDLAAISTDAPKNLKAITTETQKVDKATVDWMGSLTKVAGAVGIAFSLDAIVGFVGGILSAASAIEDLSNQWGISTTAVQKFTGAAKQSGVDAQTVGKSIQFLTGELSEGSDAYKALLANVGLSYERLRQMPLEDAYREVVRAIAGIKDETLQLDIAQGLLGASSKRMAGAIRDGWLEAEAAQDALSKEQVKRLADAERTVKGFYDAAKLYSSEHAADVIKDAQGWWATIKGIYEKANLAILRNADSMDNGHRVAAALAKDIQLVGSGMAEVVAQGPGLDKTGRTTAEVLALVAERAAAKKKADEAGARATADAKREQDAYNLSLKTLADTFSGRDLIGKADLWLKAMKDNIPVSQMTRVQQDAINKTMADALTVYAATGKTAPKVMYDIWFATLKTLEPTEALTGAIKGLKQEYATWKPPEIRPGGIPEIAGLTGNEILPGLVGAGGMAPPGLFDGLAKGLVSNLSSSILRAIEGGGNVFAAAGSSIGNFLLDPKQSGVGKAISSAASKLPGLMGSAISAAIPAVGALIGPAVEWLSKKLTSWFGKKEHDKLRDAFVSAAGGIHELDKAAAAAGKELDRLLAAKSTDAVKAAMQELEDAIKLQETAYDAAMEAAKRYGFTIEELGPAMRRQELDKQAQQLFKDWEVLNAAGIDTIAITERMSESVSTYIQQAMAMGFEVPNAMKPMLQAFADAGKLVDADGNAITDLEAAGLSFTMTMSEGFKKLIEEVHLLTDAIARGLGLAISNVPPVVVPVSYQESGAPTGPRGAPTPMESYQQGTDGFKNFGAGTPVMLHGWEAVVPREESGAFATVSGAAPASAAASAPAIIINAQGAFFNTPADLQRLADRVSEALTAKYSVMSKLRAAV